MENEVKGGREEMWKEKGREEKERQEKGRK